MSTEQQSGDDFLGADPEEYFRYYGQRNYGPLESGDNTVLHDGRRTQTTQLALGVLIDFMRIARLRAFIKIEEITPEQLSKEFLGNMKAAANHSDLMPEAPEIIMETAQLSVDRLPGVVSPVGYIPSYDIYLKVQRDQMDNETLIRISNRLVTLGLSIILKEENLRFWPKLHTSVPYPGLRTRFLQMLSMDILAYLRGRKYLARHSNEFIIPRQEKPEQDVAAIWEVYGIELKNKRSRPPKAP